MVSFVEKTLSNVFLGSLKLGLGEKLNKRKNCDVAGKQLPLFPGFKRFL